MNSDVKWMKWILEMFSLTMKLCLQIAIGHQNICEKNQIIYRHRWRCSCHIFPLGCSNTGNRSNPYCDGFCSLLVSTPELLNLNDSTTPLFRDTNMSNSLLCHFIPFDCATAQIILELVWCNHLLVHDSVIQANIGGKNEFMNWSCHGRLLYLHHVVFP